jgi:salicylate hydroxylase
LAHRILISGAGIGGLAAALGLAQKGCEVTVLEAAKEFGEVGAGIQLGPNAMKVLASLGLERQVHAVASFPESIVIADAASGKPISRMLLGNAVRERYGQAYVSLHRADLHALLLKAVTQAGVDFHLGCALEQFDQQASCVNVQAGGQMLRADALIGADGLWSPTRELLLSDGAPRATGHAAFRSLLPAAQMPAALRTPHVRAWWARDVHVVSYPLRGGQQWNLVVLAEMPDSQAQGWSVAASHEQVMNLFKRTEPDLKALLAAGGEQSAGWKRWNLFDRTPLPASHMARGRIALLGDAAHPMLPYLAQGAAMALEDAAVLAQCLSSDSQTTASLARYAQRRASRNARVVNTARRNGHIFHLNGIMAMARNAVMSWQGTRILPMDWLYGGNISVTSDF